MIFVVIVKPVKMKNLTLLIIGILLVFCGSSCNDDMLPCYEVNGVINRSYAINNARISSLDKMDSLVYERDQGGSKDTITFVRFLKKADFMVFDNCPDDIVKKERISYRFKTEDGEELVLELVESFGFTDLIVFVKDQVLHTGFQHTDSNIVTPDFTFKECAELLNVLDGRNQGTYSEKVHQHTGGLSFNANTPDYDSKAFFNLDQGLVNISLYRETTSSITYQLIF